MSTTVLPQTREVTSPSSERHDSHARLIEYFSPESIRHCLIVIAEKRVVLHHQRDPRGEVVTRIAREDERERREDTRHVLALGDLEEPLGGATELIVNREEHRRTPRESGVLLPRWAVHAP